VNTMLKVNNAYPHKKRVESTKDNYASCKTHMNSIINTQMSSKQQGENKQEQFAHCTSFKH
jgi:hypothetical protein